MILLYLLFIDLSLILKAFFRFFHLRFLLLDCDQNFIPLFLLFLFFFSKCKGCSAQILHGLLSGFDIPAAFLILLKKFLHQIQLL